MLDVCKKHNLYSKEHNGDYISIDVVNEKFNLGLNSINIAPEFGVMETTEVLKCIDETKNDKFFNDFFQICLNSNRWKKWVSDDFNIDKRKREIIMAGYIFRNNLNWNGFTVLFCEAPIIYTDNNQFFIDSLKFYDL